MCGIVGYVGKLQAAPILLEGLRRLEYRGYDSAGVSVLNGSELQTRKKKGKIDEGLAQLLQALPAAGHLGIGHTRWATHGPPSDENSHPHLDQSGRIAVVHNGVIENFDRLKDRLLQAGHQFHSATDTEVLAHLIGHRYEKFNSAGALPGRDGIPPLTRAVREALKEVIGTYGIAVVCADCPELIVGARRGSPLIIGVGEGENFLASDAAAIVAHTRQVVYLNDYDVATLTPARFDVENLGTGTASFQISQVEFSAEAAERGKFQHYMLKEIFEQPRTVENAVRGRVDHEEATAKFGGLNMTTAELRAVDQIVIAACGTSWHAALIGEHLFEEFAHLPVEVEYASEFRYRNAPIDKHTLVLLITQSGETADTLACLREARRRGHKVLSICNVVGSTIAREADGGIYLHAGPEIGVASTKAFTSQLAALLLFGLYLGRQRGLPRDAGLRVADQLAGLPDLIARTLELEPDVRALAACYADATNALYLGRGVNFPVALEGALKLKEISYIHAEGYPAAEMKHGPIALIDENMPVVFIAPHDSVFDKVTSNVQEVKARGGRVIALTSRDEPALAGKLDFEFRIPETIDMLYPILAAIPLQLLAYYIAAKRGLDVDQPRNLAKSVTVE